MLVVAGWLAGLRGLTHANTHGAAGRQSEQCTAAFRYYLGRGGRLGCSCRGSKCSRDEAQKDIRMGWRMDVAGVGE